MDTYTFILWILNTVLYLVVPGNHDAEHDHDRDQGDNRQPLIRQQFSIRSMSGASDWCLAVVYQHLASAGGGGRRARLSHHAALRSRRYPYWPVPQALGRDFRLGTQRSRSG